MPYFAEGKNFAGTAGILIVVLDVGILHWKDVYRIIGRHA